VTAETYQALAPLARRALPTEVILACSTATAALSRAESEQAQGRSPALFVFDSRGRSEADVARQAQQVGKAYPGADLFVLIDTPDSAAIGACLQVGAAPERLRFLLTPMADEVMVGTLSRTAAQFRAARDHARIAERGDRTVKGLSLEIEELRARLEIAKHAARHDDLTGVLNRAGFVEELTARLARDRQPQTVLMMDLDRFKAVNDTLGHDAGDQLLVLVARRMREAVRTSDVAARLGGDEFAILLPVTDLPSAEAIAQRLLESIQSPYSIGEQTVRIGVSIGIASFPSDGDTAEELLRNADTALYKAKAAGRDTWRAYASEDGQRQHARMALELDFRTAVATAQFTLAYQAICDSVSGAPVAFEALARWNHPVRGAISPAEFIPIAEQTGLIVPLGRWILETACAEAANWAVPVRIAVNLSPVQFREGGLVPFVRDALARTGLAPDRLDLEVTEGLLLDDADDVVKTMNALRGMGIRMALDDFGTSHSNLSYLRGFPFEVVKIDQSFVRALNTDRQARALVEAILAMARALGLEVIGEGVETPEQLALLRHLQCRLVQGYLLGRPAPAEETRDWIWELAASNAASGGSGRVLAPAVSA